MSDWIARTQEAPFDAERRIVDSHHHLWAEGQRDNAATYNGGGEPAYLPENLHADMGAHNFVGSVFVECGVDYLAEGPEHLRSTGETAFVAAQAERSAGMGPPLLGIVADADVARIDVLGDVLDAHVAAGRGRFRGIRQMPVGYGRPARALLDEPEFRKGLAVLGSRGIPFDAMLSYAQLETLSRVAPSVPETTIIVDHLGMPSVRPGGPDRETVIAAWQAGLRALARCPNVMLKLGGIGMERAFGTNWARQERPPSSDMVVARWQDEIRFAIDTLGPERCMFESNFPIDGQALGYTVLWNAFQKMAACYADAEQDALFAGTAARAYRLELPTGRPDNSSRDRT